MTNRWNSTRSCRTRSRSISADCSLGNSSDELIKEEGTDIRFFPEEGKTFAPISDRSRQIIKDQGDVEAFELLELSDKVQCTHCQRCVTSSHVCCSCERTLVYLNPNPAIEEEIKRNMMQKFDLLTTDAFILVEPR